MPPSCAANTLGVANTKIGIFAYGRYSTERIDFMLGNPMQATGFFLQFASEESG